MLYSSFRHSRGSFIKFTADTVINPRLKPVKILLQSCPWVKKEGRKRDREVKEGRAIEEPRQPSHAKRGGGGVMSTRVVEVPNVGHGILNPEELGGYVHSKYKSATHRYTHTHCGTHISIYAYIHSYTLVPHIHN